MMPLDPMVGGTVLRIPAIQSPNFVPNVSGWQINIDGSAQFNNVTLTGGTIVGPDYIINPAGAFFYTGTPAAGNLFLSIAAVAGTDQFLNPYKGGGLQIQGAGDAGQSIVLGLFGGIAELQMPTGEAIEGAAANLFTGHVGAGATEFLQTGFSGPKLNVAGHTDWAQFSLNSANAGGTSSANGNLIYIDQAGTPHTIAFYDASGITIPGGILFGVQPGTGTVATPAVEETWHSVTGGIGFTNSWSDQGAGVPTAKYRLIGSPPNTVEVIGDIKHAAIADSSAAFTLPAGYVPANQQIWPLGFLVCTAGFANAANPPLVTLTTGGVINLQSLPAGTTRVQFHCFFSLDA